MFMQAIENILPTTEMAALRDALAAAKFVDGKQTAGWNARLVKNNSQMASDDINAEAMKRTVEQALRASASFNRVARPRYIGVMFNRYEVGQTYGTHIDDAYMRGRRTDVSFTLFLSEPDSYDGGELVIEEAHGERPVKLPAGCAIVYPATTLHRVEPVTRGVRICAVGWVQSFVRDCEQREVLNDLDLARHDVFERQGKSHAFDLISKTMANLIRRWGDG